MERDAAVAPVLKWVGGKRQLLPEIERLLPPAFNTYYEPFVGGGAVLFHLQPARAVVNDINPELINVYKVIKTSCQELLADLSKHRNEREYFYRIRALDRDPAVYEKLSDVERASRILYLNKTCYNGLYRVNSKGQFNAPFGAYVNPNILNEETISAVHRYFNRAEVTFRCGDFAAAMEDSEEGDFVYFDPPYDPLSDSANFTGYASGGFCRGEQERLRNLCDELTKGGVKFLLSNAATDFILDLYKDYHIEIVQANRVVNSRGDLRGPVEELLVRNY